MADFNIQNISNILVASPSIFLIFLGQVGNLFKIFGLTIFIFSIGVNNLIGQIATTNLPPYNSAQHLIENVLLGKGVTAFNFQVYGAPIQYGFFSGGGTSIGLDSGLVLNCEDINQITIPAGIGGLIPNTGGNSGSFGPTSMGTATNNDLLSVANSVPGLIGQSFSVSSANDAAVMEFDFVPLSDTIEFRYVFGSDEYTTFINTQYNDVFAFLLSGPGIIGPYTSPVGFPGGSKNLAVVPNSSPPLPITISTVQPALNGVYYVSNQPNFNIGLNGYTTVLTAKSAVTACDTFHIRLAIADGSDHSLQSAVFIEANSFSAKGVSLIAKPSYNTLGGDSTAFEGCGNVSLTIRRTGGIQYADTAYLNLGGVAQNGIDYSLIPSYLIFQSGSDSVSINFDVLADGISEGLEDIIFSVTYNSSCVSGSTDTLILNISDPYPIINTTSNDTTINCTQGPVAFSNSTSGLSPFTYLWNTGDTTTAITVDSAASYIVKIKDACAADSLFDTITLFEVTPPFATQDLSDTIFCDSDSIQIGTRVIDGYPQINYLWNNGKTDSSIWVATTKDTSLYVNVSLSCNNQLVTDTFFIKVENPPFSLSMKNDTLNCTIDSIIIAPKINGYIDGFSYKWQNGKTDSTIWVSPNQIQNFKVVVTDACGLVSDSISNTVFYENNPIVLTTNSPTFNCLGDSVNLFVNAINGYPGYKYLWNSGQTKKSIMVAPKTTSTYIVRVTDTCGLDTAIGIVEVTQKKYPPLRLNGINNPELNCPGDTIIIGPATTSGGSGNSVVSWNNFTDTFRYKQVSIDSTAFFIVKAFDSCNLDSTQRIVSVRIAKHDPLKLKISPDTTICVGEEALLRVAPIGGAGNFSYYWSSGSSDSTILVYPNFTSAYSVSVTDDCDNIKYDNIRVRVSEPKANFNYQFIDDRVIRLINLSTNDAKNFIWTFSQEDTSTQKEPTYSIDTRFNQPVKLWIENAFGCTDSAFLEIENPLEIYAPNSFTPNDDGLNDEFMIVTEGARYIEFYVYDRWGNEIVKYFSPNFSWDGKNKEGEVVQGVYAYRLKVEGFNKQVVEKMGSIILLKN